MIWRLDLTAKKQKRWSYFVKWTILKAFIITQILSQPVLAKEKSALEEGLVDSHLTAAPSWNPIKYLEQYQSSYSLRGSKKARESAEASASTQPDPVLPAPSHNINSLTVKQARQLSSSEATPWLACAYEDDTSQPGRFAISGISPNETVLDTCTGLTWERVVSASTFTWDDGRSAGSAQAYCGNLTKNNYTDWRLPNPHELQSIVDY